MQKYIVHVMRVVVYATFFVPLITVPSSFIFPFVVPKILVFRSLAILLFGGFVILLYMHWHAFVPRIRGIAVALLAFFASVAISTAVGVDPYHSFWDNHERMLGLFTIAHYVVYFFVCSALFRTWNEWRMALRIFLFAGSIVMFIGILQRMNPFLLLNQGSERVASTLGNAIYVGGYGLFLFFTALLLAVKDARGRAFWWFAVEIFFGVLAFLGLLFSGTRGSLLGFIVGILCVLSGYGFTLRHHPGVKKTLAAALALLFVGGGLLFAYRETPWIQNLPAIGRLLNTSFGGTLTTRGIAWRIAIESWEDRPVFGWGPNNYFYAFNQRYNPRSLQFGYGETWFDNAHNILLNTLSVQGALGLLAYLGLFAVAVGTLILAYKKERIDVHLTVLGVGFLVAHLVQNIAVFENATSYLYFMFWLSMGHALSSVSETNKSDTKEKRVGAGLLSVVGVAVLLGIFVFNIQPARANMKTLSAILQFGNAPVAGISAVKDALAFPSPHIDDIRNDLTRAIVEIVGASYGQLPKDASNEILTVGVEAMQKNLALHPRDIRVYIALAQLHQLRFIVNNDAREISYAEGYLEQGIAFSPKRQQMLYMLATMKAQMGKKDEAVRLNQQAMDENPKITESYWRLAYTYSLFNEHQKAIDTLSLAKERGIVFDAQGNQAVTTILARAKDAGMRLPSR